MYCTEIALLQGLTQRVQLLINKQIKQTDIHMHTTGTLILTLTCCHKVTHSLLFLL